MTIQIQSYYDQCDDESMDESVADLLFSACFYMDKKAFIAEPNIFAFYKKRLTRLYFSDDEMERCVAVKQFLRLGLDISVHQTSVESDLYFKKGNYWYGLCFEWRKGE